MDVISLQDWPFAVRYLMDTAQRFANSRDHELTSPAHISHVLNVMGPVRAIVERELPAATMESAVLVEKRAKVMKASITTVIHQLLIGPGGRTTADFLRGYATSHPTAKNIGSVFAKHAEPIAALLDDARLEGLVTQPLSKQSVDIAPCFSLGFVHARKAKQSEVTTRHVAIGLLTILDRTLSEEGLQGVAPDIERIAELIERTAVKGTGLVTTPKLFGAVAESLTKESKEAVSLSLVDACFRGDDAIVFAKDAYSAGVERLRARAKGT